MSALGQMADNSFAAACYNDCTIAQLEAELQNPADPTDCETWGITPDEWREQIALALAAKRETLAAWQTVET